MQSEAFSRGKLSDYYIALIFLIPDSVQFFSCFEFNDNLRFISVLICYSQRNTVSVLRCQCKRFLTIIFKPATILTFFRSFRS